MGEGLLDSLSDLSAGSEPKIYGSMVATVADNMDLTGQGRVQVRIPGYPDISPWARVASLFAGDDYALYAMPQNDDEVVVAFERGDPMDPIILGGLWSMSAMPPAGIPQTDPESKRTLKTPKGHVIELDDMLQTVTVTTATDQEISLGPDSIEVSAGKGTATIELSTAGEVTIKGTTQLSIKAPAVSVEATGSLELSGASVSLKATGTCSIDGSLVMIGADVDREFLGTGWAFPVTLDETGEIALVHGGEDVHQAVRIVLGTSPGERAMRGEYGAGLDALVFEPLSTATVALACHRVEQALIRFEPRIDVLGVTAAPVKDEPGRLDISIDYRVRASNVFYNLVYPFYLIEGGEPR